MTAARPVWQMDLTSSEDPREGRPGTGADLSISREGEFLIQYAGLGPAGDGGAPPARADRGVHFATTVLSPAGTIAVAVAFMSTAWVGLVAGVLTMAYGLTLMAIFKRPA